MSTKTIVVDQDTLKKIKYFYKDDLVENKNPHALFMAKHNKTTITAYKSLKVMFQGEQADYEASIFESGHNQNEKVKTKNKNNQAPLKADDYYLSSIGSDEVGTGDYFGPVVVVAAYVTEESIDKIKSLHIDDSKKLTDKDITEIAPTLFKLIPYSLLVVKNEKYNEVMSSPSMNLNKLKAVLHKQAITNLIKKINQPSPNIVIDKFCSEDNFNRYTQDRTFLKQVIFTTKAESKYLSVACASIMARYKFLQEMDALSDALETVLLKGASDKVDHQAASLVRKNGNEVLTKIAKLHFKNTEKIQNIL